MPLSDKTAFLSYLVSFLDAILLRKYSELYPIIRIVFWGLLYLKCKVPSGKFTYPPLYSSLHPARFRFLHTSARWNFDLMWLYVQLDKHVDALLDYAYIGVRISGSPAIGCFHTYSHRYLSVCSNGLSGGTTKNFRVTQ